jgi:hypothetical protein
VVLVHSAGRPVKKVKLKRDKLVAISESRWSGQIGWDEDGR